MSVKKNLQSLLFIAFAVFLSWGHFAQAETLPKPQSNSGQVHLFTFQKGAPLSGVEVYYKNRKLGETDADGSLLFSLTAGERKIQLKKSGEGLTELTLQITAEQAAELIIPITEKATVTDIISESQSGALIKPAEAALPVAAAQQPKNKKSQAIINGQITSVETKAGIPGVKVYLTGIDQSITTDAEGFFTASVPQGRYTLSAVHGDYSARTIKNIQLPPQKKYTQDIELTPAADQLKEFVVTAPYLAGGVLALVEEKKQTSAVAEVISAEEVSRAGDSSAAGALSRVTGLTLVDGKYIYVRGMGDRYSAVRMNGAGLPSPEPSKKTVPLDMFPSEMIGSVLVQKTYSPNLPGDFGGGTVLLRTKEIPLEQTNKFSFSVGGNSRSTGKEGLTYKGGALDPIGFDDGTRELRSQDVDYLKNPAPTGSNEDRQKMYDMGVNLPNNYKTHSETMLPDVDLKFSTADRYEEYMGDSAWGYNFSMKYKNQARYVQEQRLNNAEASTGFTPEDEVKDKYKYDKELSLMGNLVYEAGDNNKLQSTTIIARSTTDTVYQDRYYTSDNSNNFQEYGLQWEERQLLSQQFHGEHAFPSWNDFKVEWQGTASLASRDSPDTRTYLFKQSAEHEGQPQPDEYEYNDRNTTRSWEDLEDFTTSLTLDFTQPIYDFYGIYGEMKGGLLYESKNRESDTFTVEWQIPPSISSSPIMETDNPEDVLTTENQGTLFNDIRLANQTQPTDSYKGEELFTAGYGMVDFTLTPWLKMMAGLRYETSSQTIKTYQDHERNQQKSNTLEDTFVLPALSLTFPYREGEQFRFAYSQTINRPMLKELSESTYIDPDTKDYYTGNPDLQIAEIQNYDLRWEKYLSSYENISFALFRKEFTNPIEVIEKPTLNRNSSYSYANVKEATNQGAELQGRLWLRRLFGSTMSQFYFGFNGSLIDSEINLEGVENSISTNTRRPLQGQAPWVLNLNLGYENLVSDIKANLLYNQQGEFITKAGAKQSPDATTGVEDTYLHTPGTLNFVYSQLIYFGAEDKLYMKIRLQNLLDGEYKETINDEVKKSYYKGVGFKISFSYSWL